MKLWNDTREIWNNYENFFIFNKKGGPQPTGTTFNIMIFKKKKKKGGREAAKIIIIELKIVEQMGRPKIDKKIVFYPFLRHFLVQFCQTLKQTYNNANKIF